VSPLQLFGLICIFAVVRLALHFRPATAPAAPGTTIDGRPAPVSSSAADVLREYLDAFIVAGLVALFLITFVIRTFYIPSGSMEPTLQIHDVLLVNEFEYRIGKPHDGDIVVFHPPIETPNDFIKRTIGSPGEQLRVHNGLVYRNGVPLSEPYTAQAPAYELEIKNYGIYVDGQPLDPTQANIPPKEKWAAPDRIPDGYYFMMGDNRNNSEDSHIWGFAQPSGIFASGTQKGQRAWFTGHAFLLFWPPQHMQVLK
jgi:signal peptidase I